MKLNNEKEKNISIMSLVGFLSILFGVLAIAASITNNVFENLHAFIYGVSSLFAGHFSVKSKDSEKNFKTAVTLHVVTFLILIFELTVGLIQGVIAAIHFIIVVVIGNCYKKFKEYKETECLDAHTKLCKHCKSPMPKQANVCTTCKRKQKNILFTLLKIYLSFCIFVFLVSYGETDDGQKSNEPPTINEDKTIEGEAESKEPEKINDNIIDVNIDDCHVKYISHEVTYNLADTKCVAVYYEFTNNSSKNKAFGYFTDAKAFQNGVELETSTFYTENDDRTTYSEIKPGTTTTVCMAYELRDDSEVTLEINKTFRDKIEDSMIIKIQ